MGDIFYLDVLPKGYERPMDKKERYRSLVQRIDHYKPLWDKNGVIQFKNERIAILQRNWGRQVEFIIAFDDLTMEGYRLMAIDEGKSTEPSGGYAGGLSSYYYFQRTEFISNNSRPRKREATTIDEEIQSVIDEEEDSRSMAEEEGRRSIKKYKEV